MTASRYSEAPASSRLIIQRLPPSADEVILRNLFTKMDYPITDVCVLRKDGGPSRGIAFVGLRSLHEAQAARTYFNGHWMSGYRIKVDFAHELDSTVFDHTLFNY
jgi:RNA recognition motif-containing protein